jgi:hypothetical protein
VTQLMGGRVPVVVSLIVSGASGDASVTHYFGRNDPAPGHYCPAKNILYVSIN